MLSVIGASWRVLVISDSYLSEFIIYFNKDFLSLMDPLFSTAYSSWFVPMEDLMIILVVSRYRSWNLQMIFLPVICHLNNYTLDLRELLFWAEVQV